MDAICVRSELTWREFNECQNVLLHRRNLRVVSGILLALGGGCLGASSALTWGTTASILDAVTFATFFFILLWGSRINAAARRKVYANYRDSAARYTFTDDQISITARYGEMHLMWPSIDRAIETATLYLLTFGNGYVAVTKRSVPPASLDSFVRLLEARTSLRA